MPSTTSIISSSSSSVRPSSSSAEEPNKTGRNRVRPVANALQYKDKPNKFNNNATNACVLCCLLAVVFGVALLFSSGEKEEIITTLCAGEMDNCSPTQRCENTASSFLCIACPQYHRAAVVGGSEECIFDQCGTAGSVIPDQQKINSGGEGGGLELPVLPGDQFGRAIAPMGDLDGNGDMDFAVGVSYHDGGASTGDLNYGSVFIIFLNRDNTVRRHTRIGNTADGMHTVGGLAAPLDRGDKFGYAMSNPGDLDGDGVPELIVSAKSDDDGGKSRGALYVLFMAATGTVKKQQKISSLEGGLEPAELSLADGDSFGKKVSVVGGVDRENGVVDVVVSTVDTVYFLRLNLDGTVKSAKLLKAVDSTSGVAGVGDVDGNGVVDIVVGSPLEDESRRGAVYVLLMLAGGLKDVEQRVVSPLSTDKSYFGQSVSGIGDLDGDGVPDLAVGAPGTNEYSGGVQILLLRKDGSMKGVNEISSTNGGLTGPLKSDDLFGGLGGIATLVERGGSEEGTVTLLVGAPRDDVSAEDGGAVYILKLPPLFVGDPCLPTTGKCTNSKQEPGYRCGRNRDD